MKQKKKYFNLRLFFIGFVGIMLGTLALLEFLNIIWLNKLSLWFIIFAFIILSNVVLIAICSINNNLRKYLKYLIVFLILFVLGFTLTFFQLDKFSKLKAYDSEVKLSGVVNDNYFNGRNFIITLTDATVDNVDKINEVKLYLIAGEEMSQNLNLGDKISCVVDLTLDPLMGDKINIVRYVKGYVYSGYVTGDIEITGHKNNFLFNVRECLRSVLNNGLSNENADIAYSVLIGDKSELDMSVKETFSYAGISHVLAVSGLHVGFLVVMLTFILNVMKVGRRKRFFITFVILLFYCFLCGCSPSVLRASFMSVVLLLGGVLGEEYDALNSLGIAGIIVLLVFPIQLFSLGFQLSFMCVFMIITLADKLSKLLLKLRIPKLVSTALSISFCTTIGTSILLANSLYEVSLISIVSNILVIPLFSVVYPMMFVIAFISMIFPFCSMLLFVPEFMLHIIKLIANFFAGINFAHFKIFNLGYFILFLFVLMSVVIKFFMGSKLQKYIISIILSISCGILLVVGSMPKTFNDFALYSYYQYSSNSALLTTPENKKVLVGIDEYKTDSFLMELKVCQVDLLVLPDFEVNEMNLYLEFFKSVKVNEVVIPTNSNFVDKVFAKLENLTKVTIVDSCIYDSIAINFVKSENLVCGTEIKINNKKLLFVNDVTKEKLETLGEFYVVYDYIITNKSKYDFMDYKIEYGAIIHSNKLSFLSNKSISLKNTKQYVLNL